MFYQAYPPEDPRQHWGHAVIPLASPDGSPLPYRVFDPCIWKQGDLYSSLSGGTLPGPGGRPVRANFLFRSPDLANWEYLHPFAESDQYSLAGDDGACPCAPRARTPNSGRSTPRR
ncbi:MAG: hypothetical protein MUF25_08640 [Pirellulaceae bacterium]|nr:hypothetical protein [Pirellulaceae bacterium]